MTDSVSPATLLALGFFRGVGVVGHRKAGARKDEDDPEERTAVGAGQAKLDESK